MSVDIEGQIVNLLEDKYTLNTPCVNCPLNEIGLDSLDIVELITDCERIFHVNIDDTEILHNNGNITIENLSEYIDLNR